MTLLIIKEVIDNIGLIVVHHFQWRLPDAKGLKENKNQFANNH